MYEIHPANLITLKEKLAAMQKRARKLAVSPITIVEHGTKMVDVKRRMPGGAYQTFQEPRVLMTVEGDAPVLAGWSLIAKVERLGDELLVSCVPGQSCPVKYRTGDLECEHCNTRRHRKTCYVLRHAPSGSYVQVGRQCVQDFLGGKDPEQMLTEAEFIFTACEKAGDSERMGRVEPGIGVLEYLCGAAICIRRLGWLSRGVARENETSTSDHAWNLMNPPLDGGKALAAWEQWVERNDLHYQDRDREKAEAALEWAKALPIEGPDYLANLGVACRADGVVYKTMGLVASAIISHARHVEREDEINKRKKAGEGKTRGHVGEVGRREVFEGLTVLYMRYIEGRYGVTTLICFEDGPGNLVKWFASKELNELKEGDVVDLKATVKEHGDYKGVKETQVTRGVIQ